MLVFTHSAATFIQLDKLSLTFKCPFQVFVTCPSADSMLLCLQEIDGKALMLLRSDIIMKYMGLKLGPALKLCHHIEKLKQTKQ